MANTTCAPGYRDDNAMLFNPISCTLNENVHFSLMVLWSCICFLFLVEFAVGLIRRTNSLPMFSNIFFLTWLTCHFIFCVYIAASYGQASVSVRVADSVVLWILLAVADVSIVAGMCHFSIFLIDAASGNLSRSVDVSFGSVSLTGFIRIQYSVATIFGIIGLILLPIMVQVTSDLTTKDNFIVAFCIIFGFSILVAVVSSVVVLISMRRIVHRQLKFLTVTPNQDFRINELKEFDSRLGWEIQLFNANLGTGVLYILVGAFIRFRYEFLHVAVGPMVILACAVALFVSPSPLVSWIWRTEKLG